jgi:hypothetical protein
MKTKIVVSVQLCFVLLVNFFPAQGQVWFYSFGSGTGEDTSSTASTLFLPAPVSGTARVRVGTGLVSGLIKLANPGLAVLGETSEIQITASSGSTSPTKFSLFDYDGSRIGYVKYKLSFSGGNDGVYSFVLGNGSSFSDNSPMSNGQIFAGIRWSLGASNTIGCQVLSSNAYSSNGLSSATNLFVQDTGRYYQIEVYANNEIVSQTYV